MENDVKQNGYANGIGGVLGDEAFSHAEVHGEDYCQLERQRIEILNAPQILAFRARIGMLHDEETQLQERIRHAPPEGDATACRKKRLFYYCLAGVLLLGVFAFSVYTLLPLFRQGWL